MKKPIANLTISTDDPDVGYLYFRDHPGPGKHGVVAKSIRVRELQPHLMGAELVLDIDVNGCLIGIEIIGD